jgi:hypothetical protein
MTVDVAAVYEHFGCGLSGVHYLWFSSLIAAAERVPNKPFRRRG